MLQSVCLDEWPLLDEGQIEEVKTADFLLWLSKYKPRANEIMLPNDQLDLLPAPEQDVYEPDEQDLEEAYWMLDDDLDELTSKKIASPEKYPMWKQLMPFHSMFIQGMKAQIESESSIDKILLLKKKCELHDQEMAQHTGGHFCNSIVELRDFANARLEKLYARQEWNERKLASHNKRLEYEAKRHPVSSAIAMGEFVRIEVDGIVTIQLAKKEVNV